MEGTLRKRIRALSGHGLGCAGMQRNNGLGLASEEFSVPGLQIKGSSREGIVADSNKPIEQKDRLVLAPDGGVRDRSGLAPVFWQLEAGNERKGGRHCPNCGSGSSTRAKPAAQRLFRGSARSHQLFA